MQPTGQELPRWERYARTLAQLTICEPDRVGNRGRRRLSASSATPFPELNGLLTNFVGHAQSILRRTLSGSISGLVRTRRWRRCEPCDFVVVTTGPVGDEHEHALRQLTRRFLAGRGTGPSTSKARPPPKADLQTLTAIRRPWLYVNRGGRELEWSATATRRMSVGYCANGH